MNTTDRRSAYRNSRKIWDQNMTKRNDEMRQDEAAGTWAEAHKAHTGQRFGCPFCLNNQYLARATRTARLDGRRLHIDLGAEVVHQPTGRIGRTVQVRRNEVFVRFVAGEKVAQLDRADVAPLSFLRAMTEVDEDEANAAAYRAAR